MKQPIELITTYVLVKCVQEKPIKDLANEIDKRAWTIPGMRAADAMIVDGVNRMRQLNAICGYVENGTSSAVKIFQDDATRDWIVKVDDKRTYTAGTLGGVLDLATAGETDDPTNV